MRREPSQNKYCPHCGDSLPDNNNFCINCGEKANPVPNTEEATNPERVPSKNKPVRLRRTSFMPISGRARWVSISLVIFMLVAGWTIISTWVEIELLNQLDSGVFVDDSTIESNDSRQQGTFVLYLLSYIFCIVTFLIWIHRASSNLISLGILNQRFSPGWAVGWWFVPFMFWFRPYQVMKEIWKGSIPYVGWAGELKGYPISGLLPVWWATFIILHVIQVIQGRGMDSANTIGELIAFDYVAILSELVGIGAASLLFILMKTISNNQEIKRNMIVEGTPVSS